MDRHRKTVVVTDDERTVRMLLGRILEQAGYHVEQAERGEQCLFLALERDVDAFLIDIRMPGLDGIELCRRIRAMERYRLAPIMFITSVENEELLADGFAAGATDLVLKPVNAAVLQARLRAHLERVRYFDEMENARNYLKRYISTRTQRIAEAYSVTGVLPAPQRRRVCVMFSDVRGFTMLSRSMPMEELFDLLSGLLGIQVDIVHLHGGYIDKFGGDGMMAVFDGENMAADACRCALRIMQEVRAWQRPEPGRRLPVGIGLAEGEVMIGNIGSLEHLDYSAIGETVNLAARLCGHARAGRIMVSASVHESAGGQDPSLTFEAGIDVSIKGFDEPVQVFPLSDPGSGDDAG
jgi:adenylate cyclase